MAPISIGEFADKTGHPERFKTPLIVELSDTIEIAGNEVNSAIACANIVKIYHPGCRRPKRRENRVVTGRNLPFVQEILQSPNLLGAGHPQCSSVIAKPHGPLERGIGKTDLAETIQPNYKELSDMVGVKGNRQPVVREPRFETC